ncbi:MULTISPECIES: GntR family transcriptional regulator [Enterobacteriaceae]|uniref:GntR family transcriptional regulator n=1 Tax=Enterobacteriaceae TaxID=543 RepID=UPI000237D275|nr:MULTISPECIES: GntR family transcriptional regulator [Enterobacteriaceae]QNE50938.1 GntR family transcriptional regulator [Klebsiella michiganensis]
MVYRDIAKVLKIRINSSEYSLGDRLPPENKLADYYNISRTTLRKAINELQKEGMIEARHGSGNFIIKKNFSANVTTLNGLSELAGSVGSVIHSKVINFELELASNALARHLNIKAGDEVFNIKRIRYLNDSPMQVEETWMSLNLFPTLTINHMRGSKYHFIEKECNIKVAGCFETFMPSIPTTEMAALLKISVKDPIMRLEAQAIDLDNNPLDYSIIHANMYEFQIKYFWPRV